jgi:hypothetical protein
MIGWKIAGARRTAPMLALAAFGTACDVSSVVGYDESALGALRCGEHSPLERCDEGACVIRDLEPAQVGSTAIAVDDDFVYYLRDASSIVTAPVGGGEVVDLTTSDGGVFRMAVDAQYLYWTEFGRRIFRVSKAGGAAEVVADIDGHPTVIALDDTYVYAAMTDKNELAMTPKEPGRATFLPTQAAPVWVATDSTHVYWINQGNEPSTGELVRTRLGDLTRTEVLLQGLDSPVALALSQSDAYVATPTELLRVSKDGGAAESIDAALEEPKSLAAYSDSVYVTSIAGLLRFRPGERTTLDARTTLGLGVACSGLVATGWLTPALLRYAP